MIAGYGEENNSKPFVVYSGIINNIEGKSILWKPLSHW